MDIKIIINLIRFVTKRKIDKKREENNVLLNLTKCAINPSITRQDIKEEVCPSIDEEFDFETQIITK